MVLDVELTMRPEVHKNLYTAVRQQHKQSSPTLIVQAACTGFARWPRIALMSGVSLQTKFAAQTAAVLR